MSSSEPRNPFYFLLLVTGLVFIVTVLAYTFMHPMVMVLARNPKLVRLPGVGIGAALDVAGATA